jgi:S1-C subfamily serine protease
MALSWVARDRARAAAGRTATRRTATRRTAAAAALLTVGLAACGGGGGAGTFSQLQAQYQRVVAIVLPSVVEITGKDSAGSGVVYDKSGDIVTNAHVLGKAKIIDVLPSTGTSLLPAKVIGIFPPDDLAVIRVERDAGSLKPARFADSADARIGQIVMAMGNPLGLTDSVSQGIVSATGRTVTAAGSPETYITSAIQTSAAINPGNSGGALADISGRILGIPTLAAKDPEAGSAAQGIGFAIPSDTVKDVAGQLIAHGKVTHSNRASLDIEAQTVASSAGQAAGVLVLSPVPDGAAAAAGIRRGDVIVGLAGQSTPSLAVLEEDLAELKPGQEVTAEVKRSGRSRDYQVKLSSLTS